MNKLKKHIRLISLIVVAVICAAFVFAVPAFTLDGDSVGQKEAASSLEAANNIEEIASEGTESEESGESDTENPDTGETDQEEADGNNLGDSEQDGSEDDPGEGDSGESDSEDGDSEEGNPEDGDSEEGNPEDGDSEEGNPEEGDLEDPDLEEADETDSEEDDEEDSDAKEDEEPEQEEDTVLIALETKVDKDTTIIVKTEIPEEHADIARFEVDELLPDEEDVTAEDSVRYYAFYDRSVEELGRGKPDDIRLFDISIMADDEEIQPVGSAEITILYADEPEEGSSFSAVRFKNRKEDAGEFDIENYKSKVVEVIRDDEDSNAISFEDDGLFVYAIAMTNEFTTWTLTAESDTYSIQVTYGRDALIPDDAELVVEEITEETDADTYTEHIEEAAEALFGDPETALAVARLFDISIFSDGEQIEPAAPVQVEITLIEPEEPENISKISMYSQNRQSKGDGEIRVVHFGERKTEVMDTETTETDDSEGEVAVSFETDGFSLFAVVEKDEFDASQNGTSLVQKLNGKSFVIVSSTNSDAYGALQAETVKTGIGIDGLAAVPVDIDTALSTYKDRTGTTATEWTFEANGTGFNIYTKIKLNSEMSDTEVIRYLSFTVDASDPTRSILTLDEKPQQISVTEGIGELAGRFRISYDNNSLNLDSQDVDKGFYGWNGINDQIQDPDMRKTLFMWLCTPEEASQGQQIDLAGKSFAIVYMGARDGDKTTGRDDNLVGTKNAALMAKGVSNLDGEYRLQAEAVEVDGEKITDPGDEGTLAETWIFERSGAGYKIYTLDNNAQKRYLAVDKNGEISLDDNGTEFTVTTKGTNRCRIGWTNPDTNITYYLNLDSSNIQDGFNFWDASWYDVPWYKNEKSFGGDDAPDWLEKDERFKTRQEGYKVGDEVFSTNWTWGTVINETWDSSELTQEQIDKGWVGEWKVQHADPESEKLYLYLCEPYDGDWPLNGYEYAIVCTLPARQQAMLTEPTVDTSGHDGYLKSSNNLIVLPDGETFVDSNGDIPLWKFEKAETAGYYYISTTVEGVQKYLSFTTEINTLKLDKDTKVPIRVTEEVDGKYVFTIDEISNSFLNNNIGNPGFHNYYRSTGADENSGDFFYLLTPTTQKSYAIVNLLYQDSSNTVAGFDSQTGPKQAAALRDQVQSGNKEILACRAYVWDEVSDDTRADYGTRYVYSSADLETSPSQWMFFSTGVEYKYYIARIDGSSLQYLSSTNDEFAFNDENTSKDNSFIFTVKPAVLKDGVSGSAVTIENSSGYRLYGVATTDTNRVIRAHKSSNAGGVVPSAEQFVLCELIDDDDVPAKVVAEKVSAMEVENGAKVVIYYRELTDRNTMTYSYYAIGRDGKRREVTDVSDSVKYWATDSQSIEWYVRDDGNNFLTFYTYNTMTQQYYGILPGGSDQNSIADSIIQTGTAQSDVVPGDGVAGTQWEMTAVRLPGRELGTYGSKIENWVFPAECFYGIKYDKNAERFRPVEAGDTTEIEFYFAVVQEGNDGDSGKKETVNTVDSKALGITIKMYDFDSDRDSPNNRAGQRSNAIESVLARGTENRTNEDATAGVLMPVMENGYPVAYDADGKTPGISLSKLFSDTYYQGEANHLFLQSVYDTTGYLQYRSENNYAYYNDKDESGEKYKGVHDFIVYKDVGASDERQLPTFSHGNFFPYNPLEGTVITDKNYYLFDYESLQLDMSDPRFGDRIYIIKNPDYHFGMTMEAKFTQPRDGIAKYGDPLYFSFNGDDDMWVFVDNVLLLDIGGVHGARSGFINFQTGEIWQQDNGVDGNPLSTSIAQRFKDAGQFPDGSAWEDIKAGNYFTNLTRNANGAYVTGTFRDYTEHDLNMYYLERGAGASNLDLTFNLMLLEDGAFDVIKELTVEDGVSYQEDYGNVEYTYRAYKFQSVRDGGDGTWSSWTHDSGQETLLSNFKYTLYDENDNIVGTYYTDATTGIFTLKPGQKARFKLEDVDDGDNNTRTGYRVEELFATEPSQYKVYINGEEATTAARQDGDWWVVSSEGPNGDLVINEHYVVAFTNVLQSMAMLELEKRVDYTGVWQEAIPDSSKTYTFVLFFEDEQGRLVQYRYGAYTLNGQSRTADVNGRIRVQAGQTIRVQGLLPGTGFAVCEEEGSGFVRKGYTLNGQPQNAETVKVWIPTWIQTGSGGGQYTLERQDKIGITGIVGDSIGASTSGSVVVDNVIRTVNIELHKQDPDGKELAGATFEVRYGSPERSLSGEAVQNIDGGAKFSISGLPVDQIYRLVEAKSPNGFVLLYDDVKFQPVEDGVIIVTGEGDYLLKKEGNVDKLYMRDANGEFTLDVSDDSDIFSNSVFHAPNGAEWSMEVNGDTIMFDVTVINAPGRELPSTGGMGTTIFYILGALLAVGAAVILIVRKRIRDKR